MINSVTSQQLPSYVYVIIFRIIFQSLPTLETSPVDCSPICKQWQHDHSLITWCMVAVVLMVFAINCTNACVLFLPIWMLNQYHSCGSVLVISILHSSVGTVNIQSMLQHSFAISSHSLLGLPGLFGSIHYYKHSFCHQSFVVHSARVWRNSISFQSLSDIYQLSPWAFSLLEY